MAERRMFAKTIIDSDAFLEMPLSTQALYFHLSMRADDDGFLNNPVKIMRMIGGNKNDYDLLIAKNFILAFETGVIVIKHWKIHNYIRNDRYKQTVYLEEKSRIETKENGAYTLASNVGIPIDCQAVDKRDTQVRLGKDRLGKDSLDKDKGRETARYSDYENLDQAIRDFIEFRTSVKKPMKTERAIKMLIARLNKLSSDIDTQIAILEQSIFKGWTDVYELKSNGGANNGGNGGNSPKNPRQLEEWELQQAEQARQLREQGKLKDEKLDF